MQASCLLRYGGLQGGRAKNVLLAMVNSETAEIRNLAGVKLR